MGKTSLARVNVGTKAVTYFSMGIDGDDEPGGLHASKNSKNVFAFVSAGAGQSGTVYRVTLF
jgi:hypothetical protein